MKSLAKRAPNNLLEHKRLFSTNCQRTPLLRTTPTQLIEHGEVEVMPTWTTYLYVLVSLVRKGTLQVIEREMW